MNSVVFQGGDLLRLATTARRTKEQESKKGKKGKNSRTEEDTTGKTN